MSPIPQETEDLVTFTQEIRNVKIHFLCRVSYLTFSCQYGINSYFFIQCNTQYEIGIFGQSFYRVFLHISSGVLDLGSRKFTCRRWSKYQNRPQKDPYIYPKWRKAEVSLIQRKIFYGNLNVISANETTSFRFLREIFLQKLALSGNVSMLK